MRVTAAESTELFAGASDAQLVRVRYQGVTRPTPVQVEGAGMIEVPVRVDDPAPGQHRARALDFDVVVAESGGTMYMVSHFHHDPVRWKTQAAYTGRWTEDPPGRCRGFELVSGHLEMARREPECKFVLALAKAWVQPAYGAHHDAITGSESDQAYLDLLTGWRDAWQLGCGIGDRAFAPLSDSADSSVVVWNALAHNRSDVVTSSQGPAKTVRTEHGAVGERLVVSGEIPGVLRYTQTLTAWRGVDRLDCRTVVDAFTAADKPH